MTRDEAITKALDVGEGDPHLSRTIVAVVEALGMVKFDDPQPPEILSALQDITVEIKMLEVAYWGKMTPAGAMALMCHLAARGLKIMRVGG